MTNHGPLRDANQLCTFRRDRGGVVCGLPAEDETVHVWPDERMRPDAHVWRSADRHRRRADFIIARLALGDPA